MPRIYEYLGILISFFSNEHDPIHVHAFYQDYAVKIEFYLMNNKIKKIKYLKIKGYEEFPPAKLKALKKFVKAYQERIIQKWVLHFVGHSKMKCERITKVVK